MIEQRRGSDDAAHWIREGDRTIPGQDSNLRLDELRAGLVRHGGRARGRRRRRRRGAGADAGRACTSPATWRRCAGSTGSRW